MIEAIKNWFRNLFGNKPDYQAMYEEQKMVAENWEFRYNKLCRELKKVVDENM